VHEISLTEEEGEEEGLMAGMAGSEAWSRVGSEVGGDRSEMEGEESDAGSEGLFVT
jgi:hypothetical protein